MDRLRQRHAGDYVSPAALSTFYLGFDVSRPPFDDLRVRRAFALATDRDTLANVVMWGSASPAKGEFIPPGLPGHSPGIGLPHDRDEARRLLAEAGYPGGSGFPALESLIGSPKSVAQSTCLQEQWRQVLQVEVRWELIEIARFVVRLNSEAPNLFLFSWTADYPDPDDFLRVCPLQRRTRWRNEAYDTLVAEARGLTDQRKRMELYRQAEQILVEEAPILPLLYQPFHPLVKPWVKKYAVSAAGPWFWKDVILEPH